MISIKRSWSTELRKYQLILLLPVILGGAAFGQHDVLPVVFRKHDAPVKALAVSTDGRTIATGGDDKMIYLWDIQAGGLIGSIENHFAVKALQFTGNGNILAACGPEIRLMDNTGKLIRTYGGYTTDIWSISLNESVRRITAGSYSKTIKVWDFDTGKPLFSLEGHEKSCLPVCFSPDGSLIASGSLDKSVRIWDATSGQQKSKGELHSGNIFVIDFHPSGKYFASASADKTIRLWKTESGEILRTFTGHTGAVFDIRFSHDGNHLISCSADRSIILWETATGRELFAFTGHTGMVNAVRFSTDEKYIVSVSDDETIHLWPLEKKCFVEQLYRKEIDEAIAASPLFGPRKNDETRQAFVDREKLADDYLNDLYEEYYLKYTERINHLSPEDLTNP